MSEHGSGMPLHANELKHLRAGHVLVRHMVRYPVIMMWLCL